MAGTIDQLNFKVILDNADFNTAVTQTIAKAEELNKSLSKILQFKMSTKQIISSTGVKT